MKSLKVPQVAPLNGIYIHFTIHVHLYSEKVEHFLNSAKICKLFLNNENSFFHTLFAIAPNSLSP